jgi:hypothetical protein
VAQESISPDEAQRLRELKGASRTTRTFEILADTGVLWVWGDDDDTLFMQDADGTGVLPVWPYAALARVECEGAASGEHPIDVAVDRFIEVWLPQIEDDKMGVAVFPVNGRIAVTLTAAEFRSKIAAARRARGPA